ncbi:MAG: SMC-Scp complex subunit ScpB [Cyanobacterium sp. T60_A2020_053]|nr:SMC-Scp complex subunit ScpB [Cyanobacterium sp. T60_A2020_053]
MGTDYNNFSLVTHIEAILYLKGKPTTIAEIGELTQKSTEAIESALIQLMSDYAHRGEGALEIVETPAGYSLQLRSCCQDLMENLIPADLNTATLRTLAAVALANPILQSDLITVRGAGAYQHVQELLELGFISKRRQEEGRSFWLEITDKFHQYFEIDQLPT